MSVGFKNNNYLNLKQPGPDRWRDADGKDSGIDSKGHAVFKDPAWGVRAGIIQLRSYFFNKEHPRRTVAGILARWAPANDTIGSLPGGPPNSPPQYTAFVSKRMGVGPNQTLETFQPNGSLGNLAQLRDLFFAMAAYEIGGGFKVPLKDFQAGLELIDPGVKSVGTDPHELNTALETAAEPGASIHGSVGAGQSNAKIDVTTVQELLRQIGLILENPKLDPGPIDGLIGSNARQSTTVKAIRAFQSRFLVRPDGVIDPNGRTWKELLRVIDSGPAIVPTADLESLAEVFPFSSLPKVHWASGMRAFAANRANGRAHAGCDLYFPAGTLIHAISSGRVIRGPYPFYDGTFALEIDHGTFLARYGEVQRTTLVREGDDVAAGQPIARVGHLLQSNVPSDMLHLELYDKTSVGPLTVPIVRSLRAPDGRPFLRRADLIDPTPRLAVWENHLASGAAVAPGAAAPAVVAAPAGVFELRLHRIREERRSGKSYPRTVGEYAAYWNGQAVPGLDGQIVERGGPGDNTTKIGDNRDLRIKAGVYRLAVQNGKYRTNGYVVSSQPDRQPKPALLLEDTGERFAVLIHPGADYLYSIGCLNPTSGLKNANSAMDFQDSRDRTIALIDFLRAKLGAAFPKSGVIPGASIRIEGEP